jgi:hypothetical protein
MTNIYIYILFDNYKTNSLFRGVYSSIKAAHRDAVKMANRGETEVVVTHDGLRLEASVAAVRNAFKGKCDVEIKYRTGLSNISLYKTRLKE